MTSCPTLPFSTYHLRHPFQKCIYLPLAPPLPSFLPSFLPTFFQVVSFSCFLAHLAPCLMQTPPLPAAGVVIAVTEQPSLIPLEDVRYLRVASYYFETLVFQFNIRTNFPTTEPSNMGRRQFVSMFYLKALLLPRSCTPQAEIAEILEQSHDRASRLIHDFFQTLVCVTWTPMMA